MKLHSRISFLAALTGALSLFIGTASAEPGVSVRLSDPSDRIDSTSDPDYNIILPSDDLGRGGISVAMKDTDAENILMMIASASGKKIAVCKNLSGKYSLWIEKVTWKEALKRFADENHLSVRYPEGRIEVCTK